MINPSNNGEKTIPKIQGEFQKRSKYGKTTAGLNQRIFAWALARFSKKHEQYVSTYKQSLFADLSGTVVEVGPGTGANLKYLQNNRIRWTGIDANPFMERYLRNEAHSLGMSVDFRIGTADRLPFGDRSIDAVICTLVLCCMNDPQCMLQEILRVLKPGGKFVFVEHVAAPRKSRLRRIQNLVTPLWKHLGDGCHPNRETLTELDRAGFASLAYEKITIPVPIIGPHLVGTATKDI